ncbi:MAG: hypothetical protein NTZ65_03110 [Candidatus Berkelbacteria bacterium]|nr:hypothetical protein [Candidatus Berkelbacteria bacterium]
MEITATQKLAYPDIRDALELFVGAGLDPDLVDKMRKSKDNALARKMIGVGRVGYESLDERFARRIMGGNFFGRDEWSDPSTYGVSFNSKQSRVVAKFPWSEAMLDSECEKVPGKSVAEACFAFLGLDKYNGVIIGAQSEKLDGTEAHGSLTIMGWQKIHPAGGQPCFYIYGTDCWYPNEDFATKPTSVCEFRWYLALKEVVPGSPSTSWENMQGMVPDEYFVPSPVMELTKDFLYYQKFKAYPNRNVYAATDTLDSLGVRVIVGDCDGETVDVDYWSGDALGDVGLPLFRKSPRSLCS